MRPREQMITSRVALAIQMVASRAMDKASAAFRHHSVVKVEPVRGVGVLLHMVQRHMAAELAGRLELIIRRLRWDLPDWKCVLV